MRYVHLFDLSNFLPSRRRDCLTTIPRLHQPSQNRTIPLAFRRVRVCVCLYGFVFALYPSLFVGEELAPPVAPNTAIPHNHCKRTTTPRPPTTTLASLVKGEVLSPKKFGRLPEGLLPIRTNPPKTSPSLKNRHHPCLLMNVPFVLHPHHPLLCTITLASLVKGRWIDGKAQALILLRFACDTSTFLICQTFCRQDGGIASPPSLACTNPPKTALSPEKALYPFTTQPFLRILDISFYPCYTFISVSEN